MLPSAVRAEVLVPHVEPLSHIALTFLPLESAWETPSGLQFITYLQDDPGKIFSVFCYSRGSGMLSESSDRVAKLRFSIKGHNNFTCEVYDCLNPFETYL